MRLKGLKLSNFRCFANFSLDISSKILLLEGDNGVGKTSLLEALHYICYLKSFRTRFTSELVRTGESSFFIKAKIEDDVFIESELSVGFSKEKRSIKYNDTAITSHKQLVSIVKVVSLIEDDINLIKGFPEKRRSFLDHYILIQDPDYSTVLHKYKRIIDNKKALLNTETFSMEDYDIWTNQLFEINKIIRQKRESCLMRLREVVSGLVEMHFENLNLKFKYIVKSEKTNNDSFVDFKKQNIDLVNKELELRKIAIGSHLDDFLIYINGKEAKSFASRGQQKLIIVLLKIAQLLDIDSKDSVSMFLLDDFMTDFDNSKIETFVKIIDELSCQIVYTCPLDDSYLKKILLNKNAQIEKLTN